MTVLAAGEGVGVFGLLGILGPLAAAVVAIVLLGPQRAKLVGESLGDAVEDLRTELTAIRVDRDQLRTDLAAARERIGQLEAIRDDRDRLRIDHEVLKQEAYGLRRRLNNSEGTEA